MLTVVISQPDNFRCQKNYRTPNKVGNSDYSLRRESVPSFFLRNIKLLLKHFRKISVPAGDGFRNRVCIAIILNNQLYDRILILYASDIKHHALTVPFIKLLNVCFCQFLFSCLFIIKYRTRVVLFVSQASRTSEIKVFSGVTNLIT